MKTAPLDVAPKIARASLLPRWLRRTLFWSTGAAVGYGALGVGLAWLFLHPPRAIGQGTPADYGLTYEPLSLTTADGIKLAAWYIPSPGANAGVVVCHGYGASRRFVTGVLPFLHRAGFALISFDFRGEGESGGRVCSFGQCEKEDVRTAVHYLCERAGIGAGHVGALGFSLGGAAAIMDAAEDPNIGAVVADSAFARLDQMVLQRFSPLGRIGVPLADCTRWCGERMAGFSVGAVAPASVVARISPRPLLLIHGAGDTHTPPAQSEELYAAAREPKQLWLVPGAQHCRCFDTDRVDYERRVTRFFREALR